MTLFDLIVWPDGYAIGKNIGLSYLPLELTEVGSQVAVEIFGEKVTAEVAPDTVYDPKGEQMKG